MLFIPEDVPYALEFRRILELTADHCMGEPGRELALSIRPSTDARVIEQRLLEVDEWARTMQGPAPIPFSAYEDIRHTFRFLSVAEYILDIEDLLRFRNLLRFERSEKRFSLFRL